MPRAVWSVIHSSFAFSRQLIKFGFIIDVRLLATGFLLLAEPEKNCKNKRSASICQRPAASRQRPEAAVLLNFHEHLNPVVIRVGYKNFTAVIDAHLRRVA